MVKRTHDRSVFQRLGRALRTGSRGDRRGRSTPASRSWRVVVRRRLLIAGVAFALWAVGIEARLVYLQVIQHDELVARAARQQNRSITAHPKRGELLDRTGRVLAYSVDADSIYAVPNEIEAADETAGALCDALDRCTPQLAERIAKNLKQDRPFAYVQRKVSPAAARRVATLELGGVGFLKENRRYYPHKTLAAHLLGYVGIDNQGLSGIESTYDGEISGRPGKILIQTDARRRAFSRVERPPTTGATIALTIDVYLQHIAERELRAAVRAHDAKGGSVIVMDPYTGEVLALANEPTFNPNVFAQASADARRNRAIQDVYEPGSTFKIVTTSAALQEDVVDRVELFDTSAGFIRVGNSIVPDMRNHGVLSFDDVIVKSSNVGAIVVGLRLGPERLSRYVRRFGFGQTISPDLPGESRGIIPNPTSLTERAVASLSMGYQVAVTPLQMAAAASAVANGGELVQPKVVSAVIQNGIRAEMPRVVLRRAITPATALELIEILEAVVERGTGQAAQVPGYTVAGKTGTTEKLVDGRYSNVEHNSSFVGFVPSRLPRLTILVLIDTPRGARYTGGGVAAPVFGRIAEAALRHLAVPPTINPSPQMLVTRPPEAPVRPVVATRATALVVRAPEIAGGRETMPDLRGLSARVAVEAVSGLRLRAEVEGVGFVASHDPVPGAPVDPGSTATLRLERRPGLPRGDVDER